MKTLNVQPKIYFLPECVTKAKNNKSPTRPPG